MIRIVTKNGVSLDLSPDTEFEISIENPMLEDSHIPVPFSTAISFQPSPTNNEAFDYIDAMMLEPVVKSLEATIYSGGMPLISGALIYDGVDDGKLNYTFSSKSVEEQLDIYIHEVKGLTNATGSVKGTGKAFDLIEQSREGGRALDFGTPMIVCKQHVLKNEVPMEMNAPYEQEIEPKVKYRNWVGAKNSPVAPAVRIKSILAPCLSIVRVDDTIERLFDSLAVIAFYAPEGTWGGFRKETAAIVRLDIADMLPECKANELLVNTLKVLCASLYRDGDSGYVMLSNSGILQSREFLNWDDKISDIYSLSDQDAKQYIFGYQDYDNGNSFNPDKEIEIEGYIGMKDLISHRYIDDNDYVYLRDDMTKDVFSQDPKRQLADIIDQYTGETESTAADSSFDAKTDFRLVKCVPVWARWMPANGGFGSEYRICPRVEFPAMDNTRPKNIYIGTLVHNQLTDKGQIPYGTKLYHDEEEDIFNEEDYPESDPNWNTGLSIIPGDLLNGIHKDFAEWIGQEHMVVSADLNLSDEDIANFRIWKKVLIRHRPFIVKKLTLTLSAASDHIACRGEFISQ